TEIIKGMKLHITEQFSTIHNYIDTDNMILRKGAVSAQSGERLIIPINMRDGSLICTGKGNPDWNFSAPHGAGRLMSRSQAKQSFTVSEYKKQMKGIYSTSISSATLDECPMAYKNINDILENISDTVTVDDIIKPIYNFKAGTD
ncbi:MAG: RtcB family protein, partial [Oscillospiraceae bacterium]|nr:RtcB family protein [Oscillospiraceae bacterium]